MLNRWLLAVAAGVILGILALYPQYNLQKNLRGAEFSGAFASCDLDEMAYASYLQALIDGRPRKNDPYTGRDDSAETPQYESLFSIQFFPAYLAAIPARVSRTFRFADDAGFIVCFGVSNRAGNVLADRFDYRR